MTEIVKPIIILGTGRCGSTVLHHLLARHPRVMWLSNVSQKYPAKPGWNRRAVSALGHPLVYRLLGQRILPSEAYRFWDFHTYGFATPYRDLVQDDVTPRMKRQVRAGIAPMLTPDRDRLLVKIAGWSRIGFLNEIFDDAKFIHIIRDGRAVASSLVHVNFWRGWDGPSKWGAGPLSGEDQADWERHGQSFVALSALQWRMRTRAIDAAGRRIDPTRFREIKYESFCEHPVECMREILAFAELPPSDEFERTLRRTPIKDSNRWRGDLTPSQQATLDDLLGDDLALHGYDASATSR